MSLRVIDLEAIYAILEKAAAQSEVEQHNHDSDIVSALKGTLRISSLIRKAKF